MIKSSAKKYFAISPISRGFRKLRKKRRRRIFIARKPLSKKMRGRRRAGLSKLIAPRSCRPKRK